MKLAKERKCSNECNSCAYAEQYNANKKQINSRLCLNQAAFRCGEKFKYDLILFYIARARTDIRSSFAVRLWYSSNEKRYCVQFAFTRASIWNRFFERKKERIERTTEPSKQMDKRSNITNNVQPLPIKITIFIQGMCVRVLASQPPSRCLCIFWSIFEKCLMKTQNTHLWKEKKYAILFLDNNGKKILI